MTRTIAIISCFIAALFLVPVQGECGEISEYEMETETECCVVSYCVSQTGTQEELPDLPHLSNSLNRQNILPDKNGNMAPAPPIRILNCVFRE